MPEQFLNGPQIGAIGKQMRSERVAQSVRVQMPIKMRHLYIFVQQSPYATRGEPASAAVQKYGNRIDGGFRGVNQFSPQGPITPQCVMCLRTKRNNPFFIPFAMAHAKKLIRKIDVAYVERGQFADPQARSIEQLDDGAVA